MSEVVASLEVALALQEKKDSSVLDEEVCDFGKTFDNREIEGSSTVLSDIAYMDSSSSIALKPLPPNSPIAQSEQIEKTAVAKYTSENNMLVFFEATNYAFDLEDLLRAEAEMLGKGTYKAELEDSTVLVVKRLKELGVTERKFTQQMEVVGSIRHENVAPLRAYYFWKDQKLRVYDYYNHGSVSAMLHCKWILQSLLPFLLTFAYVTIHTKFCSKQRQRPNSQNSFRLGNPSKNSNWHSKRHCLYPYANRAVRFSCPSTHRRAMYIIVRQTKPTANILPNKPQSPVE
ncbi:hypothetical protein LguiB_026713 [Lonicera macranthoides]